MAFMPAAAPLAALTFLACSLLTGVLSVAAALFALRRQRTTALRLAATAATLPAAYLAVVLAMSARSHERLLAAGELKYFCEIDCHQAVSVTGVQSAREWSGRETRGRFLVVKVRSWFDPRTMGPHRGEGPLRPGPRFIRAVDEGGREYAALNGQAPGGGALLWRPIRPNESVEAELVFELPADARAPRLFITDADPVSRWIIGHENSPLHRRIYFRLG